MSLINEALKKAQRQRTEAPGEPASGGDGGRIVKRSQPRSASSMFLLASGAVVLVLLSVGVTVYFVNRPAPKPPIAVVPAPPTVTPKDKPTEPGANPPVITPIVVPPPLAVAEKPAVPEQGASVPLPAPTTEPKPLITAEKKPSPAAAAPDERIHAYVEALHIAAFKAAGEESRVRVNDRNYRLNEIVDRTLGVRLIKVENDSITFADANGVTYVKYF